MIEITYLLIIGIALSMDAFSLSIGIGTLNYSKNEVIKQSIIVGIYHFIMPIIGMLFGNVILSFFFIDPNLLVIICLLIIIFMMVKESFYNESNEYKKTTLSMLFFGLSVSIDSFTIGVGIKAIEENVLIASIIFSIFSFIFTGLGLYLGKISKHLLGKVSNIVAVLFLLILVVVYLCK